MSDNNGLIIIFC